MKSRPSALRPNFRFWQFVNGGWVKLTLRPLQRLTHHEFGRDEEGYAHTVETWDLNEAATVCGYQSHFEGRDCDGRISRYWVGEFDRRTGTYVPAYAAPGLVRPDFVELSRRQRDYSAEAMNY